MSFERKNEVMRFILDNYPRWPITIREASAFQLPHGWQWGLRYETNVMFAWDGEPRGWCVDFGEYCEVIRRAELEAMK